MAATVGLMLSAPNQLDAEQREAEKRAGFVADGPTLALRHGLNVRRAQT